MPLLRESGGYILREDGSRVLGELESPLSDVFGVLGAQEASTDIASLIGPTLSGVISAQDAFDIVSLNVSIGVAVLAAIEQPSVAAFTVLRSCSGSLTAIDAVDVVHLNVFGAPAGRLTVHDAADHAAFSATGSVAGAFAVTEGSDASVIAGESIGVWQFVGMMAAGEYGDVGHFTTYRRYIPLPFYFPPTIDRPRSVIDLTEAYCAAVPVFVGARAFGQPARSIGVGAEQVSAYFERWNITEPQSQWGRFASVPLTEAWREEPRTFSGARKTRTFIQPIGVGTEQISSYVQRLAITAPQMQWTRFASMPQTEAYLESPPRFCGGRTSRGLMAV